MRMYFPKSHCKILFCYKKVSGLTISGGNVILHNVYFEEEDFNEVTFFAGLCNFLQRLGYEFLLNMLASRG